MELDYAHLESCIIDRDNKEHILQNWWLGDNKSVELIFMNRWKESQFPCQE